MAHGACACFHVQWRRPDVTSSDGYARPITARALVVGRSMAAKRSYTTYRWTFTAHANRSACVMRAALSIRRARLAVCAVVLSAL
ncbi:hypothetical protein BRM22_05740 [Xanthomonas oryzae pv. oryzae]|nr:hypothetical protein ATY42_03020 [Xanthomonas oryzae pv. oryzae]OWB23118.1 hypothetical protein XocBAI15_15170 [Xanthomonas oryzae pv. oryzicola]AOS21087.1 hypothetical protein ATY46_03025 [Xanthomonas oryzae pv. oryzae]AOS25250.1 hypothetical protein ATY47_03045 [Xanthomonas oryzae pv. oryzae]AOS29431.1 hypothetical protein ATY48_03010 [Xanthomonas oryzae pv. oryzae]